MATSLEELIDQGEKTLHCINSSFSLINGKPVMLPPAPNQQFVDQYDKQEIEQEKKKNRNSRQRMDYDAECLVYLALEQLDKSVIVLHNLAYSQKQRKLIDNELVEGQHDFIVLVPGKAVIVIEVKNPENKIDLFDRAKDSASSQTENFKSMLKAIFFKTKEKSLDILGFQAFPNIVRNNKLASHKSNEIVFKQDLQNFSSWWQKYVSDEIAFNNSPKKMKHMIETKIASSFTKSEKILLGLWLTNFSLQSSNPKNAFLNEWDPNEIMACTMNHIDRMLISQTIYSDLQKRSISLVKVDKAYKKRFSNAKSLEHIKYITIDQVKLLKAHPHVFVNGPAGSGKTIIMYARILQLLADLETEEDKVLVLVPWKDAAEEVKEVITGCNRYPTLVIDLVKELHGKECEPDQFAKTLKDIEEYKAIIFIKPNFLFNSILNKKYGEAKLRKAHRLFIDVLENKKIHIFCDDFHNSIAHALMSCNEKSGSFTNPLQLTDEKFSLAHFMLKSMNDPNDSTRVLWVGLDLIQIVQYAFWGTAGVFKDVPRCMIDFVNEIQNTEIVFLSGNLRNSYSIAILLHELRGAFSKAIRYQGNLELILPTQKFQHFIRGFTPSLYCVLGSDPFKRAADIVKKELHTILRSFSVRCNSNKGNQSISITDNIAVIPVYSHGCYIKDSFEAYLTFKNKVQSIVDSSIPEELKDDNQRSIFIDNVKYANSLEFRYVILLLDLSCPIEHKESDIMKDENQMLLNILSHLYLGVSRAKVWCSIILICSNDCPSALYSQICEILDPYVKK